MSQLISLLDSIFKTNGGTTGQWRSANEILLTHTDEVKKYCAYMKNKTRDLNKNTQLLALDFLDYSIDDGKIPLWTQVGSKEFLSSLVNIYKTRNDEEVQNKILYLIQKWANKFKKYNTIIPNFNSTYDNLKENEVEFPDNMESTYEKYLQGGSRAISNNNSNSNNNINNKFNNKEINSENKNYVKKINLDLRPSSYERKYKRLVNKLDDWTQQIQDANVFMDMANEDGFDDELRGICSELEGGKGQLVDTIESGKLKDEKLMQISLNVQSDIEMTLKRWNDVKNGRKPENFKSAFFNNNENNDYSNNNFGGNNNNSSGNQNKGGFDLLGFDDDLGGNNNNGNNNNLGNDLFDVFSGNNNNANNNGNNQGNDFFGNMGNNNNQNLFGNNDSNINQNKQNNFNNNFFGNNMNNQMNQNQNNNIQGNNLFDNFGNNNNAQNNNQNFFGNNANNVNQNNQAQNNPNNDLFSQLFNNNNNVNNANINNLQNNLNSVYTETNQFGMDFTKNNNMNINSNNNTNLNNNNNFNNIMAFNGSDFSKNNNNFNFNDNNNNQNNKNTSNKDFVFNF